MPDIALRICASKAGSSDTHCPRKRTSRSFRATSSLNSDSVRSVSPMAMRQSNSISVSSPNKDSPEPSSRLLVLILARRRGFLRLAVSHQAGSSTCQPASNKRGYLRQGTATRHHFSRGRLKYRHACPQAGLSAGKHADAPTSLRNAHE